MSLGGGGAEETLAIRVIANLQDLIRDLKSAGKETASLDLLLQHLKLELVGIQHGGFLGKVKESFGGAKDELTKLNSETQIAKALLIDLVGEYGNLDRAVQALQNTNRKNAAENKANDVTPRTGGEQVLDPKAITNAARELENLRKIQEEFGKEGANVWATMNRMMGLVSNTAVQLRSNVENIKSMVNQTRPVNESLAIMELAFRKANESSKLFTNGEITKAFNELATAEGAATTALNNYLAAIARTGQAWGSNPFPTQATIQANNALNNYLATIAKTGQAWGANPFPVAPINAATSAVSGLSEKIRGLDGISQTFFGVTLANLAQRALREIVTLMKDAIQAGTEWSRTLFNMGVAVRGLQRTGVNITMAEMNAQVDLLRQKFAFFTTRELQGGISQIALLTRNVGLSKDEIFELSEATATLAIITGKDFAEEGLLVARSIASGYTEALQRAGIAANRLAIQEKALTLGINKSFLQMTEQERAAVTLALVLDQVAAISDDTAEFQRTLAGRLQATTVAFKEQRDEVGRDWLPVWVSVRELLVTFIPAINFVSKAIKVAFVGTAGVVGATLITMAADIQSFIDGASLSVKELTKIWVESFNQIEESIYKNLADIELEDAFDQFGMFTPDFSEENADEVQDEIDKLKDELQSILVGFVEDVQDLWMDLNRKLSDIDVEFHRKSLDEWREYQSDIQDVLRKEQDELDEAQQKFYLKELKAEEDFQEKMQKLREKFLLDLEDALRERDAKQVLRLIRDFNLKTTQLEREEGLESAQRAREFQAELEDIRNQREIRLRELRIEYEERMAEMEIQKQREQADAWKWFLREMEDLEIQKKRRLEHLRSSLDAEYLMFFDHALRMLTLASGTVAEFNKIWSQLAFGGLLGAPVGIPANQINPYDPASTGLPPFTDPRKHWKGGYAEGGTLIAKKPTVALFGEKGAEAVKFQPLHRIGRDSDKVFNGRLPRGDGAEQARMKMEILLQDGLVARIIDESMGELADVVFRNLE